MCLRMRYIATVCAHEVTSVTHRCEAFNHLQSVLGRSRCTLKQCVEEALGWCKTCARHFEGCDVQLRSPDALARYWAFKFVAGFNRPVAPSHIPKIIFSNEWSAAMQIQYEDPSPSPLEGKRAELASLEGQIAAIAPDAVKLQSRIKVARRDPDGHGYMLCDRDGELTVLGREKTIMWAHLGRNSKPVAVIPELKGRDVAKPILDALSSGRCASDSRSSSPARQSRFFETGLGVEAVLTEETQSAAEAIELDDSILVQGSKHYSILSGAPERAKAQKAKPWLSDGQLAIRRLKIEELVIGVVGSEAVSYVIWLYAYEEQLHDMRGIKNRVVNKESTKAGAEA